MDKQLENQISRLEGALVKIETKAKLEDLIQRFENCVSKLEGVPQSQNVVTQKAVVIEESKLFSLKTFESKIQIFKSLSENLKPELKQMTEIVLTIVDQMIKVYKSSEKLKKPTVDQIKQMQGFFQSNLKKIQNLQSQVDWIHFSKAINDMACASFWVFASELPHQFIQGQIESSEFHALKIKQQKIVENTSWYNALHESFKDLTQIVKTEFPTGLTWNFKGEDKDYQNLIASLEGGVQSKPIEQPQVKAPATEQAKQVKIQKPPTKVKKGAHWYIENFEKDNLILKAEEVSLSGHVYIFNCTGTNITIEGKCLMIKISDCNNVNVMFEQVVSACEVINSKKLNVQCNQSCPTFNGDNSDGVKLYLANGPENTSIYTSLMGEMHVTYKKEKKSEDWEREKRLPNQFVTKWNKEKNAFEISVVDDC